MITAWLTSLACFYATCIVVAGALMTLLAAPRGWSWPWPRFARRAVGFGLALGTGSIGGAALLLAPPHVFWPVVLGALVILAGLGHRWWVRRGRAGFAELRAEISES